jgi:hypothetical protein
MTTAIRYTVLTNGTAALIPHPVIDYGQDWATQVIPKTFIAAEIGTGAGQTRDAANPLKGFLVAEFYGPSIQAVTSIELVKSVTVANAVTPFRGFITATASNFAKILYRIDNSVKGVSRLYILDQGDDASTRIGDTDTVIVTVAIGTTP